MSILGLVYGLTLSSTAVSADNPRIYAVIVAANHSDEPQLGTLRYADDDGARYYELMSMMGARAEILTVLDVASQQIFPHIARVSKQPSRRELLQVLENVFADIHRDTQAGLRTAFYFIYAGHGSIGGDGEGVLHLGSDRFSRSDLYQHVLAASGATINHVIIDACNAYLMVARRGTGDMDALSVGDAVANFLGREGLERYPNTGILVSTSRATDVHEWSRFEAGIFSHEVRSALAGAADANVDGQVTYDEVSAFLSAANGHIKDPKVRLEAFVKPPALHLQEPLFSRTQASNATRLRIPASMPGRYFIEDSRGVRFADLHMSGDIPVILSLVRGADYYFLRAQENEMRISTRTRGVVKAAPSSFKPRTAAQNRGSEMLAFHRHLFGIPYGQQFFLGHSMRRLEVHTVPSDLTLSSDEVVHPRDRLTWRKASYPVAAVAAGILGSGIFFGMKARGQAERYRNADLAEDISGMRSRAISSRNKANALLGTGGVLFAASVVMWLFGDGPQPGAIPQTTTSTNSP